MPRKKSGIARSRQINTRVTPYTFELIKEAAGHMDISEWIRKLIYSELAKLENRESEVLLGVKITPVKRKGE